MDIANIESRYKRMMPDTIEVTIPSPDQHWENIVKVVIFWLNFKNIPQSMLDEDIKNMIKVTQSYYGYNCASRWCDVLLRLEINGCDDSEISKIIDHMPRFMNGSLKDSLKLADLYEFDSINDAYFLLGLSCKQILNRLEKRGIKINEVVDRTGIWIKWRKFS